MSIKKLFSQYKNKALLILFVLAIILAIFFDTYSKSVLTKPPTEDQEIIISPPQLEIAFTFDALEYPKKLSTYQENQITSIEQLLDKIIIDENLQPTSLKNLWSNQTNTIFLDYKEYSSTILLEYTNINSEFNSDPNISSAITAAQTWVSENFPEFSNLIINDKKIVIISDEAKSKDGGTLLLIPFIQKVDDFSIINNTINKPTIEVYVNTNNEIKKAELSAPTSNLTLLKDNETIPLETIRANMIAGIIEPIIYYSADMENVGEKNIILDSFSITYQKNQDGMLVPYTIFSGRVYSNEKQIGDITFTTNSTIEN